MKDFKTTKLKWDELQKIRDNYIALMPELEPTANYILERLHKVKKIHSVRYRLKNPDSLVAKIIRKKLDDKRRKITIENYKNEITDLIGIRVLHLFKEDWLDIHNFIKSTWSLYEKPIAYVREGDTKEFLNKYAETNCIVKKHPFGYRSVHYLLKSSPTRKENVSELQVRTIFEEGWSEIDHTVRYPKNLSDPILVQFSKILNRLAGSADEMGSYVIFLTNELEKFSSEKKKITQQKNNLINNLKKQIEELKIDPKKKIVFENNLQNLAKISSKDFISKISQITRPYLLEFGSVPAKADIQLYHSAYDDSNKLFKPQMGISHPPIKEKDASDIKRVTRKKISKGKKKK